MNADYSEICGALDIDLQNVAKYKAVEMDEFVDVVSPFTRIYYIEEGEGEISFGDNVIRLEKGHLYLIPSYTLCSYTFRKDMIQYYIHLRTFLPDGLNVFDVFSVRNKMQASVDDCVLLDRLIEMYPSATLQVKDPAVYQRQNWMYDKVNYSCINQLLETRGILEQLLSKFLGDEKNEALKVVSLKANLKPVLSYIHVNLHKDLLIADLANMVNYSKDHFTRVFRSVMGYSPIEYIIRKRLEKSQYLLLTTNLSHAEIIEQTGFKSVSYFSKLFKLYLKSTPSSYRRSQ